MDKNSIKKSDAINELMKKLAEGEKSPEENGWLSNDETLSAIRSRFNSADEMFTDLDIWCDYRDDFREADDETMFTGDSGDNSMKDMVLIFLAICALWDMKTKSLTEILTLQERNRVNTADSLPKSRKLNLFTVCSKSSSEDFMKLLLRCPA